MSNLFITDIIGSSTYAVPTSDSELAAATTGLNGLLSALSPTLVYERIVAWVEDGDAPGAPRSLNCLLDRLTYNSEECPDATETQTLTASIEATLEADANITSVGQQQVHIFQAGASYFNWSRDYSTGLIYPKVTTDDVVVGGHVSPAGKWFQDGDLVLGDNQMSGGGEKLRVVGSERIEGGLLMTERGSITSPSAGEGVFWVENTAPTLPKFTDDSPATATLLYGSAGLSLYQIDQVLIVDKASGGSYTPDGTQQRPYNTIGTAITAATALTPTSTNRILILIYPGVYTEALSTADSYVYFAGFDRDSTIIRQSSGTTPPLTINDGYIGFKNLTFECDTSSTAYIVNYPSALGSGAPVLFDHCAFLGNGTVSTNNYVRYSSLFSGDPTYINCSFEQSDDIQYIYYLTGGSGLQIENIINCDFLGKYRNDKSGTGSLFNAYGCTFVSGNTSGADGTVRQRFLLPKWNYVGCHFENTSSTGNAVFADLDTTTFEDCTFVGGSSTGWDIDFNNNSLVFAKNCRFTRGIHYLIMPGDGKMYCGSGPHDVPFHRSLGENFQSINSNSNVTELRITLLEDQTLSAQLSTPLSGRDITIDGQGIYSISRTGARIVQLSGTSPVRFKDVQLSGELYVIGVGTVARVKRCRLDGRVWLQATSVLRAEDSVFIGNATHTSVLEINSDTCAAYYDGCYLKGHTGNAAVHYRTAGTGNTYDMDDLYMNDTVCMHGSLGTNNPFSGQGVGGAPPVNNYYAKQCVFNQEPDIADSTYLANQIDSGQRQNTIDPDGDYTWLAAW